jgi:sugar phosphate isomerase/epimerase
LNEVPRFSVCEFSTLNRSYDEDLAAFAAGGADGIGVAEAKLPPMADDASSVRRLRASGLKATVCLPATFSILPTALTAEPPEPERRMAALVASVRRLARFEPEVVLVLTGAAGDREPAEARRLVVEGLRELGRVGRELGVRLAVEPIHGSVKDQFTLVTDLPETEALLADAGDPSIGILFDTWHLWDTPDVLDHARRLAHRFPAVHVNDRRAHTRDWDDRALPGDGVIDLPAILGALEAGGFNGWYELEVLSSESYPDSLLLLDPSELVRRGRAGFVRAWEARTRY